MGLWDKIKDTVSTFSPVIGAGLSFLGGERARIQSADSTRAMMAFQERMRNTSYQAAVRDMRAAGLNPMLAYQQGGAATPGGASYTASDVVSPAVSTAMAARRSNAEYDLLKEQEKKTSQDVMTSREDENLKNRQAYYWQQMGNSARSEAVMREVDEAFYKSELGKIARQLELGGRTLNNLPSIGIGALLNLGKGPKRRKARSPKARDRQRMSATPTR